MSFLLCVRVCVDIIVAMTMVVCWRLPAECKIVFYMHKINIISFLSLLFSLSHFPQSELTTYFSKSTVVGMEVAANAGRKARVSAVKYACKCGLGM